VGGGERLKGAARGHKPLAVAARPGRLVELIDVASLPHEVRRLTEEPWFADRLAGMVAVRAPAAPQVAIPEHLVSEVADLWFQSMLLLARDGLDPLAPLAELRKRRG